MSARFDLLVKGGRAVTPAGVAEADVGIRAGRIAGIGHLDPGTAAETIDARGLVVLPGVIDTQVHFREPGGEHKEDLATGSAAAALGGVTAVFDMPNTTPSTIDAAALDDKLARAAGRMWVDHAFFVGAAEENLDELPALERRPGCCGVKVFMGSSTGSLLVEDDEHLRALLQRVRRRVAVHAEDEPRLRERLKIARDSGDVASHPEWRDAEAAVTATRRILALARETGARVHVLHVSTAEEMELLAAAKGVATVETTPQHLTLSAPECYAEHGTYAQMNPPIRDQRHREGLWRGVEQGVVDVIGSDHAPHTAEEKAKAYPASPSGMPGVQTLLPLLLDHASRGRLSLERLADLTGAGPARVYGIARKGRIAAGYDGDLTLVDPAAEHEIARDWLASKCGWSPFEGRRVTGWPVATVIRGAVVMREGELPGAPLGQPLEFLECLPPVGGPS